MNSSILIGLEGERDRLDRARTQQFRHNREHGQCRRAYESNLFSKAVNSTTARGGVQNNKKERFYPLPLTSGSTIKTKFTTAGAHPVRTGSFIRRQSNAPKHYGVGQALSCEDLK